MTNRTFYMDVVFDHQGIEEGELVQTAGANALKGCPEMEALEKRYQTNSKWTKGALRWSPIELPWVTLPRSACEYLTERGDEDEIYTCFVGCKNIQKMCRVSFIPWEERKKFYHEEKHFCKRSCCFLQTNMSAATEKPAPACFIFPSSWRLSTHLIRKMGEKMFLEDGYQLPIN